MAKGIALTIGLNSVDPEQYIGWEGTLNACEFDASDKSDIAKDRNFRVQKLLNKDANRTAVLQGLGNAAKSLQQGDFFLLTYSGHGGHLPVRNGDEDDLQDETWCLYDGEIVDDELYASLVNFGRGIRILVLSDSCHSGTVKKLAYSALGMPTANTRIDMQGSTMPVTEIKY